MHNRSFQRQIFPANHLHWYWQQNQNNGVPDDMKPETALYQQIWQTAFSFLLFTEGSSMYGTACWIGLYQLILLTTLKPD